MRFDATNTIASTLGGLIQFILPIVLKVRCSTELVGRAASAEAPGGRQRVWGQRRPAGVGQMVAGGCGASGGGTDASMT
ncbi:hypothetical protein E2562_031904 [Oryza meyeriana var. granulata]|uniref:Uncharacterized protein n=1 Tax=Oryza meyeriana var. granulata TaxID=110450 RepID=A0A6G1DBQ4_9ORYZ|nr:hypothetical protein E2562_031904 [Oryza meyeriana var. granulata]